MIPTAVVVTLTIVLVGAAARPRAVGRRVVAASAPRSTMRSAVMVVVAAAFGLVLAGPALALATVVAFAVARRWRTLRVANERQRSIARAYPDAIDMIVLAVHAGYLPAAAVGVVVDHLPQPVRPAFAAVLRGVADGQRFADALVGLAEQLGPRARPLVDSFSAADHYGLPLAPIIERLAEEARRERRRAADASVRQLPIRLSIPLVLCTLPSFVLLAIVPLLLGAYSSLHVQ